MILEIIMICGIFVFLKRMHVFMHDFCEFYFFQIKTKVYI